MKNIDALIKQSFQSEIDMLKNRNVAAPAVDHAGIGKAFPGTRNAAQAAFFSQPRVQKGNSLVAVAAVLIALCLPFFAEKSSPDLLASRGLLAGQISSNWPDSAEKSISGLVFSLGAVYRN